MKGICLCSGGLDSTLALVRLLDIGNQVVPMFVNYNQWSLEGEEQAFTEVSAWCGSKYGKLLLDPEIVIVRLDQESGVGSAWGRGIALVGLAAMWAYTHGNDFGFIALGNHKGDVGPDCKPGEFDLLLARLLMESTKGQIDIALPVEGHTAEDIGRELRVHGVPWEYMFSCYWSPPCGYKSEHEEYRCPGCRRKTLAMEAARVTDAKLLGYPNGFAIGRSYQSPKAEGVGY